MAIQESIRYTRWALMLARPANISFPDFKLKDKDNITPSCFLAGTLLPRMAQREFQKHGKDIEKGENDNSNEAKKCGNKVKNSC